jgi:hypothetical protein
MVMPNHADKKFQALVRLRRQQFQMAEMSEIVDRFRVHRGISSKSGRVTSSNNSSTANARGISRCCTE